MSSDYTPNEIKLFTALGRAKLLEVIDNPPSLFKICVEEAFLAKADGPAVEALRRGASALAGCKIYRHTPEFEKLIEFSDVGPPPIEIEVKSSNVKSVRWDEEENLYVRFSDSSVYRYFGVEKALCLELVQAESIGKFINQYIKGKFPCKKVEE